MTISGDPNLDNSSSSDLGLMEKGWLVQVAVGPGEMMKLRKKLRKGLMVMKIKRKKICLM
jgi:hypothetical protein